MTKYSSATYRSNVVITRQPLKAWRHIELTSSGEMIDQDTTSAYFYSRQPQALPVMADCNFILRNRLVTRRIQTLASSSVCWLHFTSMPLGENSRWLPLNTRAYQLYSPVWPVEAFSGGFSLARRRLINKLARLAANFELCCCSTDGHNIDGSSTITDVIAQYRHKLNDGGVDTSNVIIPMVWAWTATHASADWIMDEQMGVAKM